MRRYSNDERKSDSGDQNKSRSRSRERSSSSPHLNVSKLNHLKPSLFFSKFFFYFSFNQDDKERDNKSNQGEEKKELFVRNLSFKTTEDEFKAYFQKFGEVTKVKILERDGRSKGMGFVEFEKHEDAEKLITDNEELELDGRKLGISWAGDKRDKRDNFDRKDNRGDSKTKTIFVGNLSFNSTEEDIKSFFESCGPIVSVRLAMGDNGRAKGFCHIDFETEEAVENALKKNGEELDGRQLKVDKTNPRGSNGDRDRRGGRGGRDFGRRGGRDRGRGGRGGYRGRGRGH